MLKISYTNYQDVKQLDAISSNLAAILYKNKKEFQEKYTKMFDDNESDFRMDHIWNEEIKRIKKVIESFCSVHNLEWDYDSIISVVKKVMYAPSVFSGLKESLRSAINDSLFYPLGNYSQNSSASKYAQNAKRDPFYGKDINQMVFQLAGIAYSIVKSTIQNYHKSVNKGDFMYMYIFPRFKQAFRNFFENNGIEVGEIFQWKIRESCYKIYDIHPINLEKIDIFTYLQTRIEARLQQLIAENDLGFDAEETTWNS